MDLVNRQAVKDLEFVIDHIKSDSDTQVDFVVKRLNGVNKSLKNENIQKPVYVTRAAEKQVIHETVTENQEVIAEEWHKKEPRIRHEQELDQYEVFQRFQEFVSDRISRLISDRIVDRLWEGMRARYRSAIMDNTTFNSFKKLYEETK